MRLRTITGTRWPARCADGCGAVVQPSPDVKVVVDFDSHPRKTWIPEHSPDAGTYRGSGAMAQPAPTNGGNGHAAGFTPASALPPQPQAQPKAPEPPAPPKAPAPSSLALSALGGVSDPAPSASAGVAWATSQLTFNAGPYESAKSGFADYCKPGETPEQLRARVNAVVLADVEFQVRGIRELHERLSDASGGVGRVLPKGPGPSPPASPPSGGPFGGDTAIRTLSPARAAGAPPAGASAATPPSPLSSAMQTHPSDPRSSDASHLGSGGPSGASVAPRGPGTAGGLGAPPGPSPQAVGVGGGVPAAPSQGASSLGASGSSERSSAPSRTDSPVVELVRRALAELVTDVSVKRRQAKDKAAKRFCELRGLQSLRQCGDADIEALEVPLRTFERIDDWSIHAAYGVPAPQLEESTVLPA